MKVEDDKRREHVVPLVTCSFGIFWIRDDLEDLLLPERLRHCLLSDEKYFSLTAVRTIWKTSLWSLAF